MANYKIGISTTIDYSIKIEDQIPIIASHGYDFVSIGGNIGHSQIEYPERFENILKEIKSNHLFIESFHLPFSKIYDLAATGKDEREGALKLQLEFIELIAGYGIQLAILHPHSYFNEKKSCLSNAIGSLERLLVKKNSDVSIAIENLPTREGSEIFMELMTRFGPGEIGFCYDSSHENMSGDPFHLITQYYDRLSTTHLSDNHGRSDEHLTPGEGNIDWKKLAGYIKKSSIENILFEVGTGASLGGIVDSCLSQTMTKARSLFNEK